jgi:ubiquinone/menaquinone biosynthesis C-methylase UbiE
LTDDFVISHFSARINKGSEYIGERYAIPNMPKEVEGQVLELGAGTRLTYDSSKIEIYAVDITPEMTRLCKKFHPKANVVQADAKYLPFRQGLFDVVVSVAFFHHLVGKTPYHCKSNIEAVLKEASTVLKPKGYYLMEESLTNHYFLSVFMYYVTFLCAELKLDIRLFDIKSRVVTFFLPASHFRALSNRVGFSFRELGSNDWFLHRVKLGKANNVMELRKQKFMSSKNEPWQKT